MFNEIITELTKHYHELGHNSTEVDSMIDSVTGMGHRIKWGHDLEGAIHSFQLDGISGIGNWFDHMTKDFTSPDGLPLPFAEAIHNITGMGTDTAIDWLTINCADVIEVGGEVALMQWLKDNPKGFKLSLILGTLLGIIEDNPLLIGYNAILALQKFKKEGRTPYFLDKSLGFINRFGSILSKVAIGTAVIDLGLGVVGIDFAESIGHVVGIFDSSDHIETGLNITEGVSTATDIIDGLATAGIALIVSKAVKGAFGYFNTRTSINRDCKRKVVNRMESLKKLIQSKASPSVLASHLEMAIVNGIYKAKLL